MSVEKPDPRQIVPQIKKEVKEIAHTSSIVRIHTMLSEAWGDQADAQLLWSGNLATICAFPGTLRKRYITVRNMQYTIPNWVGDSYPTTIYIVADLGALTNMIGYHDKDGLKTNKIAALELSQTEMGQDGDLQIFTLKYEIRDIISW